MSTLKKSHFFYLSYFIFWFLFSILNSENDWDINHIFFEIDLRNFWQHLSAPSWSYQFCGGLSREGDVNSIFYSPFFLLPLIAGSFWGLKILIPVGMTLSAWGLNSFLVEQNKYSFKQATLFTCMFSLNSFWILHFIHGHANYVSQFLFIVSCLFFYAFYTQGKTRNLIQGFIFFYLGFSLGIYQVATYVGLPATLTILLYISYMIGVGRKEEIKLQRLSFIGLIVFAGFILVLPKLNSIMSYQRSNPRILVGNYELHNISDLVASVLLPAKNEYFTIGEFKFSHIWGIHEYSYFSGLNIIFVFFLFFIIFKNIQKFQISKIKNIGTPALILTGLILSSLIFYFGDFSTYSPFSLLNRYLLKNSHRVSPRYLLFGIFAINLIAYDWLFRFNQNTFLKKTFQFFLVLSLFFHTGVILSSDQRTKNALTLLDHYIGQEFSVSSEMKLVTIVPNPYPRKAYDIILKNWAVLNCYTPLAQNSRISRSFVSKGPEYRLPYFFISLANGDEIDINSKCFEESYFTQNEIYISLSCPEKLLLRLRDIKPHSLIKNYSAIFSESEITLIKN